MEEMEEMEDFEDIDPEILAAAQEMGLNPDQIRQLQKQLEEEGYGEEDD